MKLYAYCLAEGLDTPPNTPGISGAPIKLIQVEDISILVSDAEMDLVPVTPENALAHAAVVRSILDQTTPLPFRFGTLVTAEQLQNYIAAQKPALKSKLAHVRGCVEMNVKIIQQSTGSEDIDEVIPRGPGTAFLVEKRREILGDERRASDAAELSTFLHQSLAGLIKDEQIILRPAERLVLAAAYLVERLTIQAYREKIAKTIGDRPELHFLVSGPWPPYSFANIELEFKTHFGVT